MANWEQPRYPPRTSSRWPAPGIFVNVEFGVSMRPEDKTHMASMKYASKKMEERLQEERIRQQHESGLFYLQQQQELELSRHPTILMPARGDPQRQARLYDQHDRAEQARQRQRSLGVSMREQHERGTSAPPTVADRTQPISPISPPVERTAPVEHRLSPQSAGVPAGRINQDLPPTPSNQFRLGEADLPWSVPPWYRAPEPEFASIASPVVARVENEHRRLDDPQRVRDLETLHQAMMTVDSLSAEGWEPASWEGLGALPSGPRSLGWAVATSDSSQHLRPNIASSGPPPYVVSQWEQRFGRSRHRPRSSGMP
ncbi:hypothetical protein B0O99DRAFT_520742 [Bisporella sp. PMI_857]|nr:hypothetical protein B0O99DRAFT_520742 [Bisporella sp. PMI_857]